MPWSEAWKTKWLRLHLELLKAGYVFEIARGETCDKEQTEKIPSGPDNHDHDNISQAY